MRRRKSIASFVPDQDEGAATTPVPTGTAFVRRLEKPPVPWPAVVATFKASSELRPASAPRAPPCAIMRSLILVPLLLLLSASLPPPISAFDLPFVRKITPSSRALSKITTKQTTYKVKEKLLSISGEVSMPVCGQASDEPREETNA